MSRLEQAPVPHARHPLTCRGLLALPGALRAFGAERTRLSMLAGAAGLLVAALAVLMRRATFDEAGRTGHAREADARAREVDRETGY